MSNVQLRTGAPMYAVTDQILDQRWIERDEPTPRPLCLFPFPLYHPLYHIYLVASSSHTKRELITRHKTVAYKNVLQVTPEVLLNRCTSCRSISLLIMEGTWKTFKHYKITLQQYQSCSNEINQIKKYICFISHANSSKHCGHSRRYHTVLLVLKISKIRKQCRYCIRISKLK